jgi:hypothetical protein
VVHGRGHLHNARLQDRVPEGRSAVRCEVPQRLARCHRRCCGGSSSSAPTPRWRWIVGFYSGVAAERCKVGGRNGGQDWELVFNAPRRAERHRKRRDGRCLLRPAQPPPPPSPRAAAALSPGLQPRPAQLPTARSPTQPCSSFDAIKDSVPNSFEEC